MVTGAVDVGVAVGGTGGEVAGGGNGGEGAGGVPEGTVVGVSTGDTGLGRKNRISPNAVTQTPTTTSANTATINHWESFSPLILTAPLRASYFRGSMSKTRAASEDMATLP